jgi:hypothetical protein
VAGKRGLVSRHEFGRAWQAGQGDGFAAGPPEVMPALAVAVAKSMDEF